MPQTFPSRVIRPAPLWRGWMVAGLAAAVWGCGSELYQQRLAETVSYFEYKDQVNRELGREWPGKNVNLQPPRQFTLTQPPPTPQTAEGQGGVVFIDPSQDPRQPHFLGIELPGLIGAWEADVSVDAGGSSGDQKAYLYVLSNYDRYLQLQSGEGDGGDPQTLITDVENSIARAIGVYLQEGTGGSGQKKNQRYRETIPRGLSHRKYQPQQQFTAITFSPEVQPTDVPIEMQLYEWEGKKMQVAVLMVYPAETSPREDLQNRLLLAMETFRASDQAPSLSGSGSTSPATAGRRGAAF